MDITYRQITVGELEAFVQSEAFRALDELPISVQRGISHARNTRANPADIALFLALTNHQVSAYLGVLPDDLRISDNQKIHCGWLSCLWVSPSLRGQGVAQKLLSQALEAYDGNIQMTEFTPEAEKLYQKLGYELLAEKQGVRCYLRPNFSQWFSERKPNQATFFRFTDVLLGGLNDLRLKFTFSKRESFFEKTMTLDEECKVFLEHRKSSELYQRTFQELYWILRFPWVTVAPKKDEMASKYHFTSVAKDFECYMVKLRDANQQITGLLMVTQRDGTLKIPYIWTPGGDITQVAKAIERLALDSNTDRVVVYQQSLAQYWLERKGLFFAVRPTERKYMASPKLAAMLPKIESNQIQDGDGDAAFT